MNHLLRELAPVSDESWSEISNEATRTLKHFLTHAEYDRGKWKKDC